MAEQQRKLAAILFADIQGYTSLMQEDEIMALSSLQQFKQTLEEQVPAYRGRIIQYYGDGCLMAFDSSSEAVACALATQQLFLTEPAIPVRMGMHAGEVVFRDGNVYGDPVNIASRLESMGEPGSILLSDNIRNQLRNKENFSLVPLGRFHLKNVAETMPVFALANTGLRIPDPKKMKGKGRRVTDRKPGTGVRVGLMGALGITLLFLLSWWLRPSWFSATETDRSALMVFPFEVKGSPEFAYLGEAMVDLISTKLEGVPGIHPIDPHRVFSEVNGKDPMSRQLRKAAGISRKLGANEFILGNIVEVNGTLQISASKYDRRGTLISRKTIEGDKAFLARHIDQLTQDLIAEEFLESGVEVNSLAAMTTDNLPALKSFLLGEQAFRAGNVDDAAANYLQATELDSTFAFAWLRLSYAGSWSPGLDLPDAFAQAVRYQNKLPEKWQDLVKVRKSFYLGKASTEKQLHKLMDKYGQTRELTNEMAEYLFHHNPVHGKPYEAARPWLEKTRELDPNNNEALIHLMDIAFAEQDRSQMEEIVAEVAPGSQQWPRFQHRLLSTYDSVSNEQLQQVADHPYFEAYFLNLLMTAPEDAAAYFDYAQKYLPFLDQGAGQHLRFADLLLQGREQEALGPVLESMEKKGQTPMEFMIQPAYLISDSEFLPLSDLYAMVRDSLAKYPYPSSVFARLKYSLALGDQGPDYQELKESLLGFPEMKGHQFVNRPGKYYYYTLQAYEARLAGNNELALTWIDSAFQYSPGFWQYQAASLDKIFMIADIFQEQGRYQESIDRLENLPVAGYGYLATRGYANLRLSQLYEIIGEREKALDKCELLIRDYEHSDKKYQPWVEECRSRLKRLNRLLG